VCHCLAAAAAAAAAAVAAVKVATAADVQHWFRPWSQLSLYLLLLNQLLYQLL
jgi:hypothetical protein